MLKIVNMKVLEITEEDMKGVGQNGGKICSCGELEMSAEIIICNGKVLKNTHGAIFKREGESAERSSL